MTLNQSAILFSIKSQLIQYFALLDKHVNVPSWIIE